jgi:hypothetical protein
MADDIGGTSALAMSGGILRAVVLACLVLWTTPAQTQPPPTAPSDAEVRELEQRLDSLKQQIDQLEGAKDAAIRQGLMRENWRGMQDTWARCTTAGGRVALDDGSRHEGAWMDGLSDDGRVRGALAGARGHESRAVR